MSSLYIPEDVQAEFLIGIFGARSNKSLIATNNSEDFDARLVFTKLLRQQRDESHQKRNSTLL